MIETIGYEIVSASSSDRLIERTQLLIEKDPEGWRPQGRAFVIGTMWYQTMVRTKVTKVYPGVKRGAL